MPEPSNSEFRESITQFMEDSDKAIAVYAFGLDISNPTHCACGYHIGRASVFLEQKLDASMREAVAVVRNATRLSYYSRELRHAVVSACVQIAEWTKRANDSIGLRAAALKAPPYPREEPSNVTSLFDNDAPEDVPMFVFNSPAVKGTH